MPHLFSTFLGSRWRGDGRPGPLMLAVLGLGSERTTEGRPWSSPVAAQPWTEAEARWTRSSWPRLPRSPIVSEARRSKSRRSRPTSTRKAPPGSSRSRSARTGPGQPDVGVHRPHRRHRQRVHRCFPAPRCCSSRAHPAGTPPLSPALARRCQRRLLPPATRLHVASAMHPGAIDPLVVRPGPAQCATPRSRRRTRGRSRGAGRPAGPRGVLGSSGAPRAARSQSCARKGLVPTRRHRGRPRLAHGQP